jgi:cytochrome c-type biogenesis protein CcmF
MFKGEHLLPGNIGYLLCILSFISSIVACISYYKNARTQLLESASPWYNIARASFIIHAVSLFAIFGVLFYLIFNHRYEYNYVWAHSNNQLPFKYLLSCFWEGQEGSFLLWLLWHAVLGVIVLISAGKWESGVLTVVSAVQIVLGATILGLFFGKVQIGTSPFVLLRHVMQDAPIFRQADYLSMVTDGKGLNPLLQNYWMVIHPPVLFMGFAATLIPFAYSIAGMWLRHFEGWVKPTLTWSLFGTMVLGTGIIMGGAWAYESLSFGGYWAWDPVENASLVPWLTLVAGVHTLNIYKHSKYSLKSTLLFFILTFFLIIYSTYLTRTGILGDTSVHAFTGEGASLSYHLVGFLLAIVLASSIIYVRHTKSLPQPTAEEATWSREFWMYIGSLILLISAIQITFTTSIPVWNKLFGLKLAPPNDVMNHYNTIQIWIAILIAIGSAFVQFLKYKSTSMPQVLKILLWSTIAAVIGTALIAWQQHINNFQIGILLFASLFAVAGNIQFISKLKLSSASKMGAGIAHVGFGLMLLGILLSSFNKHVLSFNTLRADLGLGGTTEEAKRKENAENILLYRNTPADMGVYRVTYLGDSAVAPNFYYRVKFKRFDKNSNDLLEEFTLYPYAQINPKMGLVTSPDTKHYWNKDIFTYITKTIDKAAIVDTVSYTKRAVKPGDSLFYSDGYLVYKGVSPNVTNKYYQQQAGDLTVAAAFEVYNLDGKIAEAQPVYYARNNMVYQIEDTIAASNLYLRIAGLSNTVKEGLEVEFKQPSAHNDYVVLKVLVFPHINILALGAIIMAIGTGMAMYRRWRMG